MTSEFTDSESEAHSLRRIRYSKVVRGCVVYVIVEIRGNGVTEFSSQEFGEVRWYAFTPDAAERAAALALADAEDGPQWPMLHQDVETNGWAAAR